MKKNSFIPLPPFKGWVLQNFPFIEEDFDAITSYQLWCKVVAYLRAINNNVDILAEEVLEFKNYFDNLDVQEEVDNKLDEMADSGQLTDIIAQYLQLAGVLAFNTINDMKQAINLVEGSTCRTLGDFSYNDNGGAYYKVRTITNDDVVDGYNIVALDVSDTLIAERIPDEEDYLNNYRSYIDGVNGNDGNDGKTPETAWKTIDRFLEEANNRSDIRCYIISDGVYVISKPVISNTVIHITGNTDNVEIKSYDNLTLYNCHFNLNHIKLTHENTGDFIWVPYIEDGSLIATDGCIIDTPFTFYNSNASIQDSTITALRLDESRFYLKNIIVNGKSKNDFNTPLRFQRGSTGEIDGITFKTLTESSVNKLIYCYASNCCIHHDVIFETQTDYSYGNATFNFSTLNTDETTFFTFIDNNYVIDGYGLILPNIKVRDADLGLTEGTLNQNNSYYDGTSVVLDFDITGINTTAKTTLTIGTLASYLRSSQNANLVGFNNDYSPMFCWTGSNGKINIRTNDALSSKEIRVSANYHK